MKLIEKYNTSKGEFDSELVKHWNKAICKEISDLDVFDICMFIRQNSFLDTVIPIAVNMLMDNPLSGFLYEGELVRSIAICPGDIKPFSSSINNVLILIRSKENSLFFEDEEDKKDFYSNIESIKLRITQ